jgi:class 3 adenylate cyclase
MTLLAANNLEVELDARALDGNIVDIASRLAPSCAESRDDMHIVGVAHIERRLTAILMADIAGYSRLVGADEHGTLVQWRRIGTSLSRLPSPTIPAGSSA